MKYTTKTTLAGLLAVLSISVAMPAFAAQDTRTVCPV